MSSLVAFLFGHTIPLAHSHNQFDVGRSPLISIRSIKGPRSAALPSENGVAVWQEAQNVPWSLADIGHEIHHVDLVSR